MPSYSHKIPDNIMEKLSKIRDKIADEQKSKPTIQELLQQLENTYQAITGMTKEQIHHEEPNIPSPNDSTTPLNEEEKKKKEEEAAISKYLLDSYRQLVEDNQNLRNAIAFFIQKLRYRDQNLMMIQLRSNDETTHSLVKTLFDEINNIIQETENKKMIDLSKHSVGDKFATYNGWIAELTGIPKDKNHGIYKMEITKSGHTIFHTKSTRKYARFGEHIPTAEDCNLKEELKI